MRRITFIFIFISCSIFLASCGKSKDATLTPESGTVKGNLKEYFTVVEKPYLVKYDEDGWHHYVISVELQRTDVPFSFDTEGLEPVGTCGTGVYGNFGIGIDVIDADGNMVLTKSPTEGGLSGVYSDDDLKKLLTLGSGESGFVRWSADDFEKYDDKTFTFRISSSLTFNKEKNSHSSNHNTSNLYEDSFKEAEDMYEDAMRETEDMYKDAMKEAEDMYKDAMEAAEAYEDALKQFSF